MLLRTIRTIFLIYIFITTTGSNTSVLVNESINGLQNLIDNSKSSFENLSVQEFNDKYKNDIANIDVNAPTFNWYNMYCRSIFYSNKELIYEAEKLLPSITTSITNSIQIENDDYISITVTCHYSWNIVDKSNITVIERYNILNSLETGIISILNNKESEEFDNVDIENIIKDEIFTVAQNLNNDKIILTTDIISFEY